MIDLPTMQRYLNFHYSVTIDLFGSDVSSNAASYYTTGLKGRYDETKIRRRSCADERDLSGDGGGEQRIVAREVPALTALNERLRDDYIAEIQAGVNRWNKIIDQAGIPFRLLLPHKGFHRAIGNFAGHHISPEGEVLSKEAWQNHESEWLPTADDHKYVQSLMAGRVIEPGKFANYIAPPARGINRQAIDFEYVRFN